AVGAPLGAFVGAGVGERREAGMRGPEPEIAPVDTGLPIGSLGFDNGCGSVRRETGAADAGGVQVLIEGDGRVLSVGESGDDAGRKRKGSPEGCRTHISTITGRFG